MRKTRLAFMAVIFCTILVLYLVPIYRNTVAFFTDEMYWISTAKTVHMMRNGDITNPLWRENYGFTNFNGAKYVYGVGLLFFGHHDVRIVGVAPQTYFQWISYEPMPFPKNHAAYPLVFHARIISATVTAAAITLLFPLGLSMGIPLIAALSATLLAGIHPITRHVATHAFSDGMLLFWELTLLLILFNGRRTLQSLILTGASLGMLVAVKINGLLFAPIIAFVYAYLPIGKKELTWKNYSLALSIVALSGTFMFLLLHPNLFFYPEYSLAAMVEDRVRITDEHVAYFSRLNPSHVILDPQARIASFIEQVFPVWFGVAALTGIIFLIGDAYARTIARKKLIFFIAMIVVTMSVLSYCVFNEPRYYFPIVPFIAILGGYGISRIKSFTI